ncbi:MAG: response regulator [Cyclobacteriaceae bacterium]
MKKLIIIDDNKDFLELMLLSLSKQYDCYGFVSLKDLFDNYDMTHFDLLICDYNVCGDEAPDIIKAIKSKGLLNDQPVLLISGSDEKSLNEYNLDNGHYLEKPFKFSDLKNLLQHIFDENREEAPTV